MYDREVPSDDEVVASLRLIGGSATASRLCKFLMEKGHPKRQSQLAIQRATERQRLQVNEDWTLEVAERQPAVA